ncbi:MAG: hypothetical protein ACI9OJ_000672 [Myxococcota bacterium]|jgi:hypothetical protein
MKLMHVGFRVASALILTVGTFACSADGTGTNDGSTDGTDGTTSATATAGTDGTDGTAATDGATEQVAVPRVCDHAVRPVGYVQSSGGDIVYQNNPLTISARASAAGTCTNRVELGFERDGGCNLDLTFEEMQGVWMMTAGTFKGDVKCGEFWAVDDKVTFELDTSGSVGALMNLPDLEPAENDGLCAEGQDMKLVGNARFVAAGAAEDGTDRITEISLSDLGFKGVFKPEVMPEGGCPQEPRLCQGVTCGRDFFGAECGVCGEGFSCSGGACAEGGCRASSPDKTVGFHIGEKSWTESTGDTWNLHDTCEEASAVWMIKTATWCSACYALRFEFQRLYDTYAPRGVKFVLIVGQDAQGYPATQQEAAYYKQAYGYQDGWISISDPNFQGIDTLITSTYNAIPEHIILDKDLVLRKQSGSTDFVFSQESALLQILAEQGN